MIRVADLAPLLRGCQSVPSLTERAVTRDAERQAVLERGGRENGLVFEPGALVLKRDLLDEPDEVSEARNAAIRACREEAAAG